MSCHSGDMVSGTLDTAAELMLGLNYLKSLLQPMEFYDSKEMEQGFHEGCRISILRGAQNVSGCSPEQSALVDPALSNGTGLDSRTVLQPH